MNLQDGNWIAADIAIILGSGLIFQSLKQLFCKKIFPYIGSTHLKLATNSRELFLFSKQFWGLLWHVSILILELSVLVPSDFWTAVINPYHEDSGKLLFTSTNMIPTGIRVLYLLQLGYFLIELFYITLIDRPHDVYLKFAHHLFALALLTLSYLPSECWKIGAAVLFLHELFDVAIYASKTLHYAQFKRSSEYMFAFTILVMIWSRLIMFPKLLSLVFYSGYQHRWQTYPCFVMLSLLLCMHLYWTRLMLRVFYKSMIKQKVALGDPGEMPDQTGDVKVEVEVEVERQDDKNMRAIVASMSDLHATQTQSDEIEPRRRRSSAIELFVALDDNAQHDV